VHLSLLPCKDWDHTQGNRAQTGILYTSTLLGQGVFIGARRPDSRPLGACPRPPNPLDPRDLCVRMSSTGGNVIGQRAPH
jgi:hypothetical protein